MLGYLRTSLSRVNLSQSEASDKCAQFRTPFSYKTWKIDLMMNGPNWYLGVEGSDRAKAL